MNMRKLWPLLMAGSVGAMGLSTASAENFQLLVGSYTAGSSQGIYRMTLRQRPCLQHRNTGLHLHQLAQDVGQHAVRLAGLGVFIAHLPSGM